MTLATLVTVRVWHDAKFHIVEWNRETAPILRCLYRDTVSDAFYNPLASEWKVLSQFASTPVSSSGS